MPKKTKFGFGSSSNVEQTVQSGKINARDVVFLDENTDNPKVGWVTLDGKVVVAKPDLSEVESDVEALETAMTKKADVEEVNKKINEVSTESVATAKAYTDGKVEAAMAEHLGKRFEISGVPVGTLVDMGEHEIRVLCPEDSVFVKQSVGAGGDPNCYYMTFKTFAPCDEAVGYIEHLNGQVDVEILTDLKTDKFSRRYQPTWLTLARYDEATDTWTRYGENSTSEKMVGYDYQIDWFDANGVMIASDSVRINLSNEECHFINEPYYVGKIRKEVDTKIEEKIAEVESAYEIVEF